jgi:hypothetical protein
VVSTEKVAKEKVRLVNETVADDETVQHRRCSAEHRAVHIELPGSAVSD